MQALNRMSSFITGLQEIVAFFIYSERQTDLAILRQLPLLIDNVVQLSLSNME